MVLQDNVGDIDIGFARSMSEVHDQLDWIQILTRNVTYPEDIILTCLQIDVVLIDDSLRVVLVGQFHHHTVDVAVAVEDTREVVVVGCRCNKVRMEVNLCLPLREALLWNGYIIVVVATLEERLESTSLLIAPSWIRIIVERHGGSDTLPHVELTVRVESAPLLLSLLRGKGEVPCNTTVGSLIDKHQFLSCQRLDTELRILILSVAGDIWERCVRSQLDVGLLGHITFSILPVVHLKAPGRYLITNDSIEVGCL